MLHYNMSLGRNEFGRLKMVDTDKINEKTQDTDLDRLARSIIDRRWAPNFSVWHRALRAVWQIVWLLFAAWTPPQMNNWRRTLLKMFGAQIAHNAIIQGGAKVWYPPNLIMLENSVIANGVVCYNMDKITIGKNSVVSQRAVLCGGTHDFTLASNPLEVRPIEVGSDVWIASEAFIGPGVIIPDGCVIGARAVVLGELKPWTVYVGNPAHPIKLRKFDRFS